MSKIKRAVLRLLVLACLPMSIVTSPIMANLSPEFVPWNIDNRCLIRHVFSPQIKICIEGSGDYARAQANISKALLLWIDPLRNDHKNLTKQIVFTCDNPDGHVVVSQGWTQEMAGGGVVWVSDQSAFGTYLHEYGHAFACIGDTYVNSTAGYCMDGQPHSVMCDGLLRNDLSFDDISAVRYQFQRLLKNVDGAITHALHN